MRHRLVTSPNERLLTSMALTKRKTARCVQTHRPIRADEPRVGWLSVQSQLEGTKTADQKVDDGRKRTTHERFSNSHSRPETRIQFAFQRHRPKAVFGHCRAFAQTAHPVRKDLPTANRSRGHGLRSNIAMHDQSAIGCQRLGRNCALEMIPI